MATQSQFVQQPTLEYGQVSSANTNRDGTGSCNIISSGPSLAAASGVGKRIARVKVVAVAAVTAGVIRFYLSNDANTTRRLCEEILVPAITPSTSVKVFYAEVPSLIGTILPGGTAGTTGASATLQASTNNAETFNIFVDAGTL